MTWQFVTGPTRLSMVSNLCIFQRVSVFYKQILPFYTKKTQCVRMAGMRPRTEPMSRTLGLTTALML